MAKCLCACRLAKQKMPATYDILIMVAGILA
jgi:hypothetical protein